MRITIVYDNTTEAGLNSNEKADVYVPFSSEESDVPMQFTTVKNPWRFTPVCTLQENWEKENNPWLLKPEAGWFL